MSSIIEEAITGLEDIILTRQMMVAAAALIAYDWLTTLGVEVDLIWKARWSSVKVIYCLNRYFLPLVLFFAVYGYSGFAHWFTSTSCKIWITTDSFIILFFFAGLHYIVTLRAWALWTRDKYLGILIWSIYAIYFGTTFTIAGKAVISVPTSVFPIVDICSGTLPNYLWAVWLPSIIYESFVFALTISKAIQHSRRNVEALVVLKVLYRDGFLYFIFISLNSVVNLLWWAFATPTRVMVVKYFSVAICQVAGAHLVLDLLEVGKQMQFQNSTAADSQPNRDKIANSLAVTSPPTSPLREHAPYQFGLGKDTFEMQSPVTPRSWYPKTRDAIDPRDRTNTWYPQELPYDGARHSSRDRTSRTVRWSNNGPL